MSIVKTLQIESDSSEHTELFAEQIGHKLKGGEVIELISDLGGGKTTFVRGLVRGTGSPDHVASPTFTVSRVYKTPALTITHFDFYRLHEAGLMEHELHDALTNPQGVVVVEWGAIVAHVLPDQRVSLRLTRTGSERRHITCSYPTDFAYLFQDHIQSAKI